MCLFYNRFINLYFIEYNNTYSVMFYTCVTIICLNISYIIRLRVLA